MSSLDNLCDRYEAEIARLENELKIQSILASTMTNCMDSINTLLGLKLPIQIEMYHGKEKARATAIEDAIQDLQGHFNPCWYCANPDIEDAWRHVHGEKGAHWHHRIDPGDGLASDCANSEMFERIYQATLADPGEETT